MYSINEIAFKANEISTNVKHLQKSKSTEWTEVHTEDNYGSIITKKPAKHKWDVTYRANDKAIQMMQ